MLPSLTLTYGVRLDAPTFPDTPTPESRDRSRCSAFAPTSRRKECSGLRAWASTTTLGGTRRSRFAAASASSAAARPMCGCRTNTRGRDSSSRGPPSRSTPPIAFRSWPIRTTSQKMSAAAATNEVNLLDPDYKYPQVMRWNLAYDRTDRRLDDDRGVPPDQDAAGRLLSEPELRRVRPDASGRAADHGAGQHAPSATRSS